MVAIIPPVLLPGSPNVGAQRYGLFNVLNGPLELDIHARGGGYAYTTELCELPYGYDQACPTPANVTADTQGLTTIVATPFLVQTTLTCGAIGHTGQELTTMAFNRLRAGEQAAVENIFSQGLNGQSPSLANNNPNVTTLSAAASINEGIGKLEAWLYARYGPAGILHVPIYAAEYVFSDYHIMRDTGGVMRTPMGTAVSFGNYANLLPNGTAVAAGHAAFFITGQMTAWRASDNDVFISPWQNSVNKTTNQVTMIAEREYVLAYDCFAAGIDVTLGAS